MRLSTFNWAPSCVGVTQRSAPSLAQQVVRREEVPGNLIHIPHVAGADFGRLNLRTRKGINSRSILFFESFFPLAKIYFLLFKQTMHRYLQQELI